MPRKAEIFLGYSPLSLWSIGKESLKYMATSLPGVLTYWRIQNPFTILFLWFLDYENSSMIIFYFFKLVIDDKTK